MPENKHGYDPSALHDAKSAARGIIGIANELQGLLDKCEAAHREEPQTTAAMDKGKAVREKLDALASWTLGCVCNTLHAFPNCGRLPVEGLMQIAGQAQERASGEWAHALERTAERLARQRGEQAA